MSEYDAVVVGSGPNGLAAAVVLARAGLSVCVYERSATIGGGSRTSEQTLPEFRHDLCSAVHPMALASEFFQKFELQNRIDMITPEVSYGTPLDNGRAAVAYRDIERTAEGLGRDGAAWKRLMGPLSSHADEVARFTGSQMLRVPPNAVTAIRFGLRVLEQGTPLWNLRFREDAAPALLSGVAAHCIRQMPSLSAAATALSLGAFAHARGWPIPVGGSQVIVDSMALDLIAHGGDIVTSTEIKWIDELPTSKVVLFDTSAKDLARIAASRLPSRYARTIGRFRYGSAVAKVDFALAEPVPWANESLNNAGTLHLGGDRAEMARSEDGIARGRHSEKPLVLVAQPSTLDKSRAPRNNHVLWAYAHVPHGSTRDQTEAVTKQIERFAPGFRDVLLASVSKTADEMGKYNPNYVGGDILSGAASLKQLLARPTLSANPWKTPAQGIYLCSSSTPPGPGVHGLSGYHAALSALKCDFGIDESPSLAPYNFV